MRNVSTDLSRTVELWVKFYLSFHNKLLWHESKCLLGTNNPWCWESDRLGPRARGRGQGVDNWGDLENFRGRQKYSIFDYGISYVGINISQSLLHSKWLHFIVWKLYQNELPFKNINDKPNHLLSVSIKGKSLKKRRFMDPITLRIQSAGLLITSLWDKERELEARRASKEKHGVNFIHIHLLSLLMAAQASTALPGPLKQKVRKRYVVHLICNIMFAVGNRTRVYRAELNCAHRTHQCTNHVPKARPLPRVFLGGCVGAMGQAWRCPSQPAEARVLLPLGRLQSFNLFLHCWAGSLLTKFFI